VQKLAPRNEPVEYCERLKALMNSGRGKADALLFGFPEPVLGRKKAGVPTQFCPEPQPRSILQDWRQ
jgi:hypothetical protein